MRLNILFILFCFITLDACKVERVDYVCKPCDLSCDTLIFDQLGICPHCGMELFEKKIIDAEKSDLFDVLAYYCRYYY